MANASLTCQYRAATLADSGHYLSGSDYIAADHEKVLQVTIIFTARKLVVNRIGLKAIGGVKSNETRTLSKGKM